MAYFNQDGFQVDPFSGATLGVEKALDVSELLRNDTAAEDHFLHPALRRYVKRSSLVLITR